MQSEWENWLLIKYIWIRKVRPFKFIYSMSHEIYTWFYCNLISGGLHYVLGRFMWYIYPFSSGLLNWHLIVPVLVKWPWMVWIKSTVTKPQGVVSLTFRELSKILSRNLCIAEIVLVIRISSWNFVRVPKATRTKFQLEILITKCDFWCCVFSRDYFGELAKR